MVQENIKKFGIYLNPQEMKVVRINSPYWFPPEPDWVMITNEVIITIHGALEAKQRGAARPHPNISTG